MSVSTVGRRMLGAILTLLLSAGIVVSVPTAASAAVVRPFTLNYNKQVFGDFIELGNGNSACPGPTAPTDPFGEPKSTCPLTQARTYTSGSGINDSYYMQWADVDSSPATFNSSTGTVTIPPGARVDFARLNWAGDTGTIRLADGTISPAPGCGTRQFDAGGGTAVLPAGTPESTSVRLTVGAGATTAVAPQVISRDALANVPAYQPQYYTAHAEVTTQLRTAPTGSATTITVGNVWTLQGFGCFAGWSLVVVYAYDEPDPTYAPTKREIFIYDGHVRQSSSDPPTTITVSGFRVAANPVRLGLTAYEGDFNISGDSFIVNGVSQVEPIGGQTTNFWVSDAANDLNPAVSNNLSIDAKQLNVAAIDVGDSSAQLQFTTVGDTYLAQNLVLSVPVPAVSITKETVGGPFRPGQQIPFVITVVAPGTIPLANVLVDDPLYADCDRDLGTLPGNVPVTYTCTGPAPGADGVNTAIVTGEDNFGDPVTDSADAPFDVINPAIDVTKTADALSYQVGDTITFTITVNNTGDATLTNATVTDAKAPACDRVEPTLTAGSSVTYTCTAVAPLPDDENTAVVVGTDPLNGQVTDSATVAVPVLGSVSGRVFADRDGNGVLDVAGGDTGIGGVTVTLTGTTATGSPLTLSTTTSPTGTYTIDGVPAGTYQLAETQPASFDDGVDTPGNAATAAGNDAFTVTLAQGVTSTGNNFAELATSSIAGVVFEDLDGDGVRDGVDPGIAGATVTLTGTDASNNALSLTATSDGTGSYTFPQLPGGVYAVTESQPAGFNDGAETVGTAGGTRVPPDSITGIPLAPRTTATGYLFAETKSSSVTGAVVDEDGIPIEGVTVALSGPAGLELSTTTNTLGNYTFTGLRPGTYTVTETQPVGWGEGGETVGNAGGVNSAVNVISGIVIQSNQQASGYIFVDNHGALSGSVYIDADNDGMLDVGESGISGVVVTLTGTDDTGAAVSRTATTVGNGSYQFGDLLSGNYTLTETQPSGYLDGRDTAGSQGGTASPDAITQIDLQPGINATSYLFGELLGASIAGTVFDDAGNPINAVTLTLIGTNDLGTPVTLTETTNTLGNYTFTGLRPGTYTVTETQPTGYGDGTETVGDAGGINSAVNVISGIELDPGQAATGYAFVEALSSLAGIVYVDVNNNGTKDDGEPGIADVEVSLTATNDTNDRADRATTTTDANGEYRFDDLLGGSYTLTETQPVDYEDGRDTPGSAGGTPSGTDSIIQIDLPGGGDATGYLFGEFRFASIAGQVFDDAGNPIEGVVLTLTDTAPSRAPSQQITDENGAYRFDDVAPGNYTITETQPDGYGDGPDTVGSAGGSNTANDVISGIVIDSDENATGYDFEETLGSLTGVVYDDRDDDGTQDGDEPGIPGVTVTLTGTDVAGRGVSQTDVTDADGDYEFTELVGGVYTVSETQANGYADGKDTAGPAGGTVTGPDSITGITLEGGASIDGYLFGELGGLITGTVFVDPNGNGVLDLNEPRRLANVTVVLRDSMGVEMDSTTTASDGSYRFVGIVAGEYTVEQEQPNGYGSTTPNEVSITVPAGGGDDADFGERHGSIGDVVWSDTNRNGIQDSGEPGVAGVLVTLLNEADEVLATTTSDSEGHYRLEDLLVGMYRVRFTAPDGKTFTAPNRPGAEVNSDVDRAIGTTGLIQIAITDGTISWLSNVDAGVVDRVVDLDAEITVNRRFSMVGDLIEFTGMVTNVGTVAVSGAIATFSIPAGLSIDGATGDGWTCTASGQYVRCVTARVMEPGEAPPPISVTTTATRSIANTMAVIFVTLANGFPDDNQANDSAATVVAVMTEDWSGLAMTGGELTSQLLVGLLAGLIGLGALITGRRYRRRAR